jgi:hypothetical protein
MEALRTLYIIALCYRATKANAVELAECFDAVSHDAFTRLLGTACDWHKRLWQEVTKRLPLRGGWLELDDTVLDKFGAAIWGVFWVYSAPTARCLRPECGGVNLDGWATTLAAGVENLAAGRL